MINKSYNRNYKRILALATVIAIVLFVFFATFYTGFGVADAVSPTSFKQNVSDKDLDWWLGEEYLNIDGVKKIVDDWFNDDSFDFSNVKPIVVAIIDTGVNINHELFLGNYDDNGNPIDSNGIGKYDVLYRDENGNIIKKNTTCSSKYLDDEVTDDHTNMHGTHVAGIVATLIHELNLEKYIKIMPIKAYEKKGLDGEFSVSSVNNAINFAIENGADVVNLSISSKSEDYASNVDEKMASKAVFVAAAGNRSGGENTNVKRYPGGHENIIGVMNYNKDKLISSKSYHGKWYDLCAPGSEIMSAGGSSNDTYVSSSGTSMASPIVAFAAALLTLKCRGLEEVSQEHIGALEIAEIVKNSSSRSISHNGGNYKVLDLELIAGGKEVVFARIKCVEGDLEQIYGSVSPVKLEVKIFPNLGVEGSVKWLVNGQIYSNQPTITYTPNNTVGKTTIEAVWSYQDEDGTLERRASCELNVNYFVLNPVSIKSLKIVMYDLEEEIVQNKNLRLNDSVNVTFSNFNEDNVSPDTVILWYVNGEYYSNGISMDYKADEFGEYIIQARINGTFTSPIIVNVTKFDENIENGLKIASIVISAIIVASIVSIVIAIAIRKNILNKKMIE